MTDSAHRLLAMRGYVRTTAAPGCDHATQLAALVAAGADEDLIETDDATYPGDTRPGLERLLAHANPGDTLLVWRLDRLAWSPAHLARTLTHLDRAGVRVKSIRDDLDTGAARAGAMTQLCAAMVDLERDIAREYATLAALKAREEGRPLGRPSRVSLEQWRIVHQMAASGSTHRAIAVSTGLSKAAVGRVLRREIPSLEKRYAAAEDDDGLPLYS